MRWPICSKTVETGAELVRARSVSSSTGAVDMCLVPTVMLHGGLTSLICTNDDITEMTSRNHVKQCE